MARGRELSLCIATSCLSCVGLWAEAGPSTGSSTIGSLNGSGRLLIVPLFRGSSRFESLILSHHSRYKVTCECNEKDEAEPSRITQRKAREQQRERPATENHWPARTVCQPHRGVEHPVVSPAPGFAVYGGTSLIRKLPQ